MAETDSSASHLNRVDRSPHLYILLQLHLTCHVHSNISLPLSCSQLTGLKWLEKVSALRKEASSEMFESVALIPTI